MRSFAGERIFKTPSAVLKNVSRLTTFLMIGLCSVGLVLAAIEHLAGPHHPAFHESEPLFPIAMGLVLGLMVVSWAGGRAWRAVWARPNASVHEVRRLAGTSGMVGIYSAQGGGVIAAVFSFLMGNSYLLMGGLVLAIVFLQLNRPPKPVLEAFDQWRAEQH